MIRDTDGEGPREYELKKYKDRSSMIGRERKRERKTV